MNPFLENLQSLSDLPVWFVAIVTAWILIWKGLALWKAAKRNSPNWFVILLIVNTIGILEILYYYLFSEMNLNDEKGKKENTTKQKSKRPVRKNLSKQKSFLDQ